MIKLFSLKQEKEAAKADENAPKQKIAPGMIRTQKGAQQHAPAVWGRSPSVEPCPALSSHLRARATPWDTRHARLNSLSARRLAALT